MSSSFSSKWHSLRRFFLPRASFEATPIRVALASSMLSGIVGMGLTWTATHLTSPQLGLFFAAFGLFHMLEFLLTAQFKPLELTMNSFLLTNGIEYPAAQLVALLEALIHRWIWPASANFGWVSGLGLLAMIGGQVLRSIAMIQAATSFNHVVAEHKKDDHILITRGVYSRVRHPSYTGYFVWAIGSQIMLLNYFSAVAFAGVLYTFFRDRIRDEETHLDKFFGVKYKEYRQRVPSGIPFVH